MNTKKLRELRERHAEGFHIRMGRTDVSDGFMQLIDAILEPEPAPEAVVGEQLHLIADAYSTFRDKIGILQGRIAWPRHYADLDSPFREAIDAFALRLIERVRSERGK